MVCDPRRAGVLLCQTQSLRWAAGAMWPLGYTQLPCQVGSAGTPTSGGSALPLSQQAEVSVLLSQGARR